MCEKSLFLSRSRKKSEKIRELERMVDFESEIHEKMRAVAGKFEKCIVEHLNFPVSKGLAIS